MYKYLLFDLDETLLDFKKAERHAVTEVLKKFGLDASDKTVKTYSKINLSCWKQYERGEITREQIYKNRFIQLGEWLGVEFNVEEFSKEYALALSHNGYTYPFAVTLLNILSKKGYKIAAATNGALTIQTGRLVNSGLAGFFKDGIFISEQIGLKKPQPEFFEFILKAMGVKNKSEALVIGDSPSSDIAGAIGAGLDCCFVNLSGESLTGELKPTYTVSALEDIIPTCGL